MSKKLWLLGNLEATQEGSLRMKNHPALLPPTTAYREGRVRSWGRWGPAVLAGPGQGLQLSPGSPLAAGEATLGDAQEHKDQPGLLLQFTAKGDFLPTQCRGINNVSEPAWPRPNSCLPTPEPTHWEVSRLCSQLSCLNNIPQVLHQRSPAHAHSLSLFLPPITPLPLLLLFLAASVSINPNLSERAEGSSQHLHWPCEQWGLRHAVKCTDHLGWSRPGVGPKGYIDRGLEGISI